MMIFVDVNHWKYCAMNLRSPPEPATGALSFLAGKWVMILYVFG